MKRQKIAFAKDKRATTELRLLCVFVELALSCWVEANLEKKPIQAVIE